MSEGAAKPSATEPLVIGRYALFDELAAGGMATVHLGRLLGPVGFGRTVAVKRLHSHYVKDQEFVTMFMDEARIVARIRHPNVVPMVDVVQSAQGLFLVMEYIHGESLSKLMRAARSAGERIPYRIVTAIICNTLHGLHAAHETKGPKGELLGVVHRDVSPQNVMVGADGVARVLDFGIAKAAGRSQVTREGQIKGKLAYMAPEQIRGQVDRRTDVFAAAVCLWEALTGRRLHEGLKDVEIVSRIVVGKFPPPSTFAPDTPPALDQIVLRGLVPDPKKRFSTAKEMALEIENNVGLATPSEVSAFVEQRASEALKKRQERLSAMEIAAADLIPDEAALPPPSLALPSDTDPFAPAPLPGSSTPPDEQAIAETHTQTTTAGAALMSDVPVPPEPIPMQKVPVQWIVLGACALLAFVGLILGGYAIVARKGQATQPDPSSLPEPPPAPTTIENHADAGSTTYAAPVESAPPPVVSASAKAVAPPPSATTKATATTTSRRKGCEQPYWWDGQGKKHLKPECVDSF